MLNIYVDADACPVKEEIFRVAMRHNLQVYLVSNSRLNMIVDKNVHKIRVESDLDAADNWIEEHIETGDIVVTFDILLAERCLKKCVNVLSPTGRIFNNDTIGVAKAMRDLRAHLRETSVASSYNATFSKQDRSCFLQSLEEMIQTIKRRS
ncbi:MAG: YaiI/YqxD family protein [Candidatus Dependentiae bacterium]|nr:YaiI/YqxD family protein [Candidatus Dependentiae bacterium]